MKLCQIDGENGNIFNTFYVYTLRAKILGLVRRYVVAVKNLSSKIR